MTGIIPLIISQVTDHGISYDQAGIGICFATGKMYECGSPVLNDSGGSPYWAEYSIADGTRLHRVSFATSMPVSGNNQIIFFTSGRPFVITPAGNAIIAVTCLNTSTNHLRLSKFSTSTLQEISTLPFTSAVAFASTSLSLFRLNNVNYAYVIHSNNKVEIFDIDAMASVKAQTMSPQAQAASFCGKKLDETQQLFYYFDFGAPGSVVLRRWIYNRSTNIISAATVVRTIPATDWDVNWGHTDGSGLHDVHIVFSVVDQVDGNIIVSANQHYNGNQPGTLSDGYLAKVNITTGVVMWKIAVPNSYAQTADNFTPQNGVVNGVYKFAPGWKTLSGYSYPWTMTETSWPLLTVDTVTGTYTSEQHPELAHFNGTNNGMMPPIYDTVADTYLFYDQDGKNGFGNGWFAAIGSLVTAPPMITADMIGGTTMVLDTGLVRYIPVISLPCQRGLNSEIEVGPLRYAEQKQADETALISTLVIGLSQQTNPIVFYEDFLNSDEGDEDWLYMTTIDDVYEDWGFDFGDSDDFTAELMSTDDGINSQPQQPEILEPVEDHGAAKQYSPAGYSAVYHRLKLKAAEPGESYALKFIDIAGTLTGRHI